MNFINIEENIINLDNVTNINIEEDIIVIYFREGNLKKLSFFKEKVTEVEFEGLKSYIKSYLGAQHYE